MATRNINRPPRGDQLKRLGAYHHVGLVSSQDTPSMRVNVGPALVQCFGAEWIDYSGGVSPEFEIPSAGTAKWDLIGLNKYGQLEIIQGTPASNDPLFPIPHRSFLPLAAIFIEGNDTEITSDMVFDIRPFLSLGDYTISHSELDMNNDDNLHGMNSITGLIDTLAGKVGKVELTDILKSKADVDGTTAKNFTLNKDETGVPASTVGFTVKRGDMPDVGFRYNEQKDVWEFTNDGTEWFEFSNGGFIFKANDVDHGISRLSVAPVDAEDPISVGDNDPRLSDSRTPTTHAASHVGGTDAIPNATTETSGLMSASMYEKLSEISSDRIFEGLVQKTSVLNHVASEDDPHGSISSHNTEFDHTLLIKNIHTKYIVSADGTSYYNTIQGAIDAVVANNDNTGNISIILVRPGTYVENLIVPDNIVIMSVSREKITGVSLNGTVTFQSSTPNPTNGLIGINVVTMDEADSLVSLVGAGRHRFLVANCTIQSFFSNSLILSNTDPNTTVFLRNCEIISEASDKQALTILNNIKVQMDRCTVKNEVSISMKMDNSSSCVMSNSNIIGLFDISGSASLVSKYSTFTNAKLNQDSTISSANMSSFINCTMNTASTYNVNGAGGFSYSGIVYTGSSILFGETLNAGAGAIEIPSSYSSRSIAYKAADETIWDGSAPTNVQSAIDRLAQIVNIHLNENIP